MAKAIKAENLSKVYQLGEFTTGTLSQDIERFWYRVRGKEDPFLKIGETNDRSVRGSSNVVWSLKDIDFEIEQGDAVGVIGRNGAGKSTLLKILSRVTTPTTGIIRLKGRIASLLEVGTGFHPELTGRENIFLNGAILGMRKQEIKSKFAEIVDFAGVERYIDTPVKRYSSGMYVRLAFAVAAHLNSEILVVDEVLAVGDAEFQKKCLGKMGEVSKEQGRTILFVSHNISSIKALCNKGLLLANGQIKARGPITGVVDTYLRESIQGGTGEYKAEYVADKDKESGFDILQAAVTGEDGVAKPIFTTKEPVCISIVYRLSRTLRGGVINFSLDNREQIVFLSFDTDLDTERLDERAAGTYKAIVKIPAQTIKPGNYSLSFNTGIANLETYLRLENCLSFAVTLAQENESFISYAEKRPGVVAMPLQWITEKLHDGVV
jgi:lipopolysaccharide transport system ATP-binding protein